ncbi:MAG: CarD family transcriptional regulator [Velocimicrobium sp.]
MFEVGDYIIYGNNGVCKVDKIGTMDVSGTPKGRLYYTLSPVYAKGSTVFTPVDNKKVMMRPVISKEEAWKLIDDMNNIDTLWISDERRREECYKDALKSCDAREWIKIIKTLYIRKKSRVAEGKKVTTSDQKYLRMAEDSLFGELAIPLEMDKSKVEDFIATRVKKLEV